MHRPAGSLGLIFKSGGSANSHDPLRVHMLRQALPYSPIQTSNRGDAKGNKQSLAKPASDALARLGVDLPSPSAPLSVAVSIGMKEALV